MRNINKIYFYPEYIAKELTRSEGRRVPLKTAVEDPKTLEIKLASQKLGYKNVDVDKNAAYPRQWFHKRGLVFIEKNENNPAMPKQELIKQVSKEINDTIRPMIEKKKRALQKKKKESKKKIKRSRLRKSKKQKGIRRR